MQVILYKTVDSANVINKTLTNSTPIEISFRSNVDILKPEILLLDDGNYSQFNYCHIPLFNRYYYCEGYERVSANLIKLSFYCDVVETYKHDIMNSYANYNRKIDINDYLNIPVNHSIRTESILYHSDRELSGQSMILTSLGVNNEL